MKPCSMGIMHWSEKREYYSLGLDTLTWTKCIAVVMIFLGVTIVNQSRTVIK